MPINSYIYGILNASVVVAITNRWMAGLCEKPVSKALTECVWAVTPLVSIFSQHSEKLPRLLLKLFSPGITQMMTLVSQQPCLCHNSQSATRSMLYTGKDRARGVVLAALLESGTSLQYSIISDIEAC